MKQIIVLETMTGASDGGLMTVRVVFWLPVAVGNELPRPSLAQSAYPGATADELTALQNGTVVEEARTFQYGITSTNAVITAALQKAYTDRVAYLSTQPARGKYYGVYFDGTAWH